MQARASIIVSGDVQGVGYRDIVSKIARKLKLTGFVENIQPYDVNIVCEGTRENINYFIDQLKIKEYPINVEDIKVEFCEPAGKFNYFKIIRGDIVEELGERLDIARLEMNKMVQRQDQMLEKQDQMLEKQDQMLEKQDQMLEKQDQMIGKQDQMLGKQDQMINKLDGTTSVLKEFKEETNQNFAGLNQVLLKHDFEEKERIRLLKKEVSEIKTRLISVEHTIAKL